ncbi:MAG: four helix bundle protein [Myxococcales bacterium]|nr:four helix bundle protein [Myxococcales bacterium]
MLPYDNLLAYDVAAKLLVVVRDARIRDAHLRDQALRAAKNACLNTAEGAGRDTIRDKARAYTSARSEVTEAVAAVEIAAIAGDCDDATAIEARALAGRAIGLLTGLIKRTPQP